MPNLNFTDLGIQRLARGLYFDDRTPGFGLRVLKNRKTWLVVKGKNRTKVSLGHYPALSLQEARRKAMSELSTPSNGRPTISFSEAKKLFLEQGKWRPRTKKVIESSLRHFSWTKQLDKITHHDVATELEAIRAPSARTHALKDIRAFFNWCVPRYLAESPAKGLKMPPQKGRNRVLTEDELKRVWNAAGDSGTFGKIAQLLILTGQRKTEIGTLQWDQVRPLDIHLPEGVTKNGRSHTFPLGTLARSVIDTVTRRNSTPFLFTATANDNAYNGYAFHLKKLHKKSETSAWTLHDLRRTFATGLASLAVPIHVTEKLLNHVSGTISGVTAVYNQFAYWEEQKDALEKWEARVLSVARG